MFLGRIADFLSYLSVFWLYDCKYVFCFPVCIFLCSTLCLFVKWFAPTDSLSFFSHILLEYMPAFLSCTTRTKDQSFCSGERWQVSNLFWNRLHHQICGEKDRELNSNIKIRWTDLPPTPKLLNYLKVAVLHLINFKRFSRLL